MGDKDDDNYSDEEDDVLEDLNNSELSRLNQQLEAGSRAGQMADIDDRDLDMKEAQEQNYYRENMFSREDLHLYKGVMLIYVGKF